MVLKRKVLKMGRVLAIDYGSKRCGIAVTDPDKIIASPLDTVHSSELMAFLTRYTASEDVECFVVGLPVQKDGSPSPSSGMIEEFVRHLRRKFPSIKIERVDEMYTSVLAGRAIREGGARKKDRHGKALLDKVSAAIILQSYLEMNNHA